MNNAELFARASSGTLSEEEQIIPAYLQIWMPDDTHLGLRLALEQLDLTTPVVAHATWPDVTSYSGGGPRHISLEAREYHWTFVSSNGRRVPLVVR